MADLGTLALGTFTNVSLTAITGAEPVLQVIASADDAKDVHDTSNTTHTGVASFALGDTPGDLGNVDTVSIRLRYGLSAAADLNVWDSLTAQVVESDGSTPLTDEVTVVSGPITNTTPANSSVVPLTNPNTSATKETWDAALVLIRFAVTKNKGGDAVEERVFAAEVMGTYTAASGTTHQLTANASGLAAAASVAATIFALGASAAGVGATTADVSVSQAGETYELTASAAGVGSATSDVSAVYQVSASAAGVGAATLDMGAIYQISANAVGVGSASSDILVSVPGPINDSVPIVAQYLVLSWWWYGEAAHTPIIFQFEVG